MTKRRDKMPDGRYIIYYTFAEDADGAVGLGGGGCSGESPCQLPAEPNQPAGMKQSSS